MCTTSADEVFPKITAYENMRGWESWWDVNATTNEQVTRGKSQYEDKSDADGDEVDIHIIKSLSSVNKQHA